MQAKYAEKRAKKPLFSAKKPESLK